MIFEARTTANKGCANSGSLEWRLNRRQKHISGFAPLQTIAEMAAMYHGGGAANGGGGGTAGAGVDGGGRQKRDVREAIKYIETALIVDKSMFEKRNGSTRAEVVHDAIQVANIADLVIFNRLVAVREKCISNIVFFVSIFSIIHEQYFRTLNTRVSVVYIETWGTNQAQIDGGKDISKAISNFNDYTSRNLFKIDKDTTQLLT